MWMGVVALKGEVGIGELVEGCDVGVEPHDGEGPGRAGELESRLVEVVEVEMGVAEGMYKCAGPETGDLGGHHQQEGVGGYVEGDAEEAVGRALVEL